jgi:hypothetical protein
VAGLSEAAVGWLEAQAALGGLVLADNDQTEGSVAGIYVKSALGETLLGVKSGSSPGTGYLAIADAVIHLWRIVNGGVDSIVGPYPDHKLLRQGGP